jgi:hypothetical protein
MLVTMGSSPIESVVAAGNIFIGQVSCNNRRQAKQTACCRWGCSLSKTGDEVPVDALSH